MLEMTQSLTVFLDENADEQVLVKRFVELGYSLHDAERIVVFAPIAFARQLINNMAEVVYAEEFDVETSNKSWVSLRYQDEPVFIELDALAQSMFQSKSLSRDHFMAIAKRSW